MTEEEMQAAIKAAQDAHNAELEALRRKNEELIGETKAEREKRRQIEAAKAEADAAAEAAAAKRAAEAGDVEAMKAQWEAKAKRERDELAAAKAESDSRYSRLVVDGGIRDAMAKAGVAPSLAKGAALAFRDGRKIEISDDMPMVDGVPLSAAVEAWAGSDEGSPYKAASFSSGGHAPGGSKSGGQGLSGMSEAERMALATKDPAALKRMSGRA